MFEFETLSVQPATNISCVQDLPMFSRTGFLLPSPKSSKFYFSHPEIMNMTTVSYVLSISNSIYQPQIFMTFSRDPTKLICELSTIFNHKFCMNVKTTIPCCSASLQSRSMYEQDFKILQIYLNHVYFLGKTTKPQSHLIRRLSASIKFQSTAESRQVQLK